MRASHCATAFGANDSSRSTTRSASRPRWPRALDYAHQQGIIHRDIKPENILLTRDGSTLVTDFGIARAVGADEGLTQTGVSIGTPVYMSPEQIDDCEVDARADLYSLATVLYEMLAGEPPFTGRSVHAIVAKRLAEPTPSVRALQPTVPPGVDAAIQKAMAPIASDRFASVGQFGQALHVAGPSSTATTTAAPSAAEAPRPTVAAPTSRQYLPVAAVALIAGLLIGGGLLFAWRRTVTRADMRSGTHVVAVLPFDNLGDSADAYFADGVSDEVRTRLGKVAGLEVIARGSSLEYRHAAKRPTEIARELGADYLLTGTVRWEKSGGASRVRVTPELVDARPGHPARSRWSDQFDASLTDVFQVQGDIATKVADALGVALADSTQRELTARPTENLAAYDEFLKGEAASQAMSVSDPASLRRAIGFYERAVALDSLFATAWARLSHAQTRLYANGVPDPALGAQARLAAERARRLKPNDPLIYRAFGTYYSTINPVDLDRALAEYEQGIRLAPDNVVLLGALGVTESNLGRWDSAATLVARAALLDPRSADIVIQLADILTMLRQYARADSAADQALALAPTNPRAAWQKVMVALGQGHLDGARAVIRASARQIDPMTLFSYMVVYQDLYWVLDDEAQRLVLALPPSAFDDDRGAWGSFGPSSISSGVTAAGRPSMPTRRGSRSRSRAGQRPTTRSATRCSGWPWPIWGGGRGRCGKASERWSCSRSAGTPMSVPTTRSSSRGSTCWSAEPEKALDQLEPLLRIPSYLSPGWLRIDPTFDPLRSNPRFKKLVEGTA